MKEVNITKAPVLLFGTLTMARLIQMTAIAVVKFTNNWKYSVVFLLIFHAFGA
jgi:hypothetical protein